MRGQRAGRHALKFDPDLKGTAETTREFVGGISRPVERLEAERGGNFRASLVVDARSGFQKLPRTGEFSRRNGMKNADAA